MAHKAELAIVTFRILLLLCCLSWITVFTHEVVELDINLAGFDAWLLVCDGLVGVAYLLAGAVFMIWFYTIYKSLYLDSPHILRYRPAWTFLGFSLPIANLFMPYLLVVKMWHHFSEIHILNSNSDKVTAVRIPHYIGYWWLLHLVCFFGIPAIYAGLYVVLPSEEFATAQLVLSLSGYVLIGILALLAIRLVQGIQLKKEKYKIPAIKPK